jgi:hypothetical protein
MAADSRRSRYCARCVNPRGHHPAVVVLELPEDVAGAETTRDEEDQLLRQRSVGTDHT